MRTKEARTVPTTSLEKIQVVWKHLLVQTNKQAI